jgi:predicted phosphoadenosine phosphosulfate sulfurtransferase
VETIHSDKNTNKYKSQLHKKKMYDNVYNAYQYLIGKVMFGLQIINSIELIIIIWCFHQAGLTIDQMRVVLFNSTAQESLKLYKVMRA